MNWAAMGLRPGGPGGPPKPFPKGDLSSRGSGKEKCEEKALSIGGEKFPLLFIILFSQNTRRKYVPNNNSSILRTCYWTRNEKIFLKIEIHIRNSSSFPLL